MIQQYLDASWMNEKSKRSKGKFFESMAHHYQRMSAGAGIRTTLSGDDLSLSPGKGKVPIDQIGMNVKMWIDDPESQVFKERDEEKNVLFQGGYEPIPDIVLFKPTVNGDWRRRNNQNTLRKMLMAIEVKASENKGGRMSVKTISRDIEKLVALRHEVGCLGASFVPVMLIIDTAPTEKERMTSDSLGAVCEHGKSENINLFYFSSDEKREIAW